MSTYDETLAQLVESLPIHFSPQLPVAGELPTVERDAATDTTFELSCSPDSPSFLHVTITPHASLSAEETIIDDLDRSRAEGLGLKVALLEYMGVRPIRSQEDYLEKLRTFVRQRTVEHIWFPELLTPLNEGKNLLLFRREPSGQIYLRPATHGYGHIDVVVQLEEHQASATFDQVTLDRFMRKNQAAFLPAVLERLTRLVPVTSSPIQRLQTSTPVTPSNNARSI